MSDGKALIDLSNLTEPATVLVHKICNAVGILFEPSRLVRLAQAKAHIELIEFNSRQKLSELEQRALSSFINKESRKQENIEQITANAITSLPPGADASKIEDDWLRYFFNICEQISDDVMQQVWGNILAKKTENPKAFSKKTLSILAILEAEDAETFVNFCSFVAIIEGDPRAFLYDLNDAPTKEAPLVSFGKMVHLQALGLIYFDDTGFIVTLENDVPITKRGEKDYRRAQVNYFGTKLSIYVDSAQKDDSLVPRTAIRAGQVALTEAGVELFRICNAKPIKAVLSYWTLRMQAYDQMLEVDEEL